MTVNVSSRQQSQDSSPHRTLKPSHLVNNFSPSICILQLVLKPRLTTNPRSEPTREISMDSDITKTLKGLNFDIEWFMDEPKITDVCKKSPLLVPGADLIYRSNLTRPNSANPLKPLFTIAITSTISGFFSLDVRFNSVNAASRRPG